ncbi:MAG: hypothetical protein ACTSRZ_01985 [Promethearchaeota archaeon]
MIDIIHQFTPPGRTGAFLNLDQGLGLASFFIVIGYEVLLWLYFLIIKFRETKKMYWMYYSLFFFFGALSRGVFIIYDYMMPYFIDKVRADPLLPLLVFRVANFIGWLAMASMVGILAILMFTGENRASKAIRIICPLIIVAIGSLFFILPDNSIIDENYFVYSDPYGMDYQVSPGISATPSPWPGLGMGSFVLNLIVTPAISFFMPVIFLYLAYKSVGLVRKSSALNGIGFLAYWVGRFSRYFFAISKNPRTGLPWTGVTQNVWPAMIILLGLLFLALANMMLQQK